MIRVLLVDDQALFRVAIATLIDLEDDIEVVGQAADGLQALRLVDETEPDVVVMDVRMPRMDGVETTRRLLAAGAARRTAPRVIILTTFTFDQQALRAVRLGASGFLLKDVDPDLLVAAIRTAHRGGSLIAPGQLEDIFEQRGREPAELPAEFSRLTDRERAVLAHITRGLSNAEIAEREFVSESTVKGHVSSVLTKLGLRDRTQIVVFAYDHGVMAPREE
jgi:DNA-binding NarL/FixJ family response regulator